MLDKYVVGILDSHRLAGVASSRDLLARLPFGDRTEAIDDRHPETVAHMRGPLMMVSTDSPDRGMMPFYVVRDQTYTTHFQIRV